MSQAVPSQHPAVVLRSHFNLLRALLAVALIAVIGLTVAVVILADGDQSATSSAAPIGHTKYGGLNPSTGQPVPLPQPEHPLQSRIGNTRSEGASGKDSKNAATGDNEGDAPESPKGPGARTD
jgi:hypothetical protein